MEKLPDFDYYNVLGVSNKATSTEIRTAYRKLILKCHPDKIQDASLRAVKQVEFQKVQEAYENLCEDKSRREYDELLKKIEIRRQMSQGKPTPWSNPFEYEIKTPGTPNFKVYMYKNTTNGATEGVKFSKGTPGQSNSGPDLRRSSRSESTKAESVKAESQKKKAREEEIRKVKAEIKRKQKEMEENRKKKEEEAKQRHKEKEEAKRRLARKKEKERKEKRTRNSFVDVYEVSDDEYRTPRSSEKKPGQNKSTQEVPMNKKWTGHQDYAGAYVHASLKKSDIPNTPSPSGSYGVRFTKSSDNTPRVSRDKKQSPETPSPLSGRKPSLKSQTSAPPLFRTTSTRRRSQESTVYSKGPSSMPKAQTFSGPSSSTAIPNLSSFSYLSVSNNTYTPGYNALNRSFSSGYYPADHCHVSFATHIQASSTESSAHRASFSSYNTSHNIKMLSADNVNYSPRYGYEHVNFASHSIHYASPGYS
ncbi:hypothetical protein EV44_g5227 [Erysiphe necator]|uniref:J domain-containing protein n=1 Tax=Uncinula necator TaxID=52586 RepID=A0A0B1PAN7_UNCNE|nr:hypothetical protein EV44_g5227 [Erysiphe necator]